MPSIGSVPLGTTFHVVATAPIQYSTVRPVLISAAGLKVACFARGFFAAATFGDAAPDGSTNASSAATGHGGDGSSQAHGLPARTTLLHHADLRRVERRSRPASSGPGRHESSRECSASV